MLSKCFLNWTGEDNYYYSQFTDGTQCQSHSKPPVIAASAKSYSRAMLHYTTLCLTTPCWKSIYFEWPQGIRLGKEISCQYKENISNSWRCLQELIRVIKGTYEVFITLTPQKIFNENSSCWVNSEKQIHYYFVYSSKWQQMYNH